MAGAVQSPDRLRPLGVGELLDAAIKVCTAHVGPLMKAVLVVVLPVQIVSAVILASTVSDPDFLNITTTFSTDPDEQIDTSATFWAGQLVVTLLSGVSYLLATGACFHAIAQGWLGREPDWRASLRFAARRVHSLLWITVLYSLGVLLGLVACIVPGIWLGVAWSVCFPVLFVEDARGSKALVRSFGLVQNRWWASFGVLAIGFVLAAVVASIFTYGLGALALINDSLGFLILLTTLGALLSALLTTPFQAAIVTVLYFDLRVRKEGFDLELLADRLAGGAPLGRPTAPSPFITPAGTAEWGAPHPAAPYWPPPPGWTPPEEQSWQAPSGWQPPGAPPPTSPPAAPAEEASRDTDPFGRTPGEGKAEGAFGGSENDPPRWLPPSGS